MWAWVGRGAKTYEVPVEWRHGVEAEDLWDQHKTQEILYTSSANLHCVSWFPELSGQSEKATKFQARFQSSVPILQTPIAWKWGFWFLELNWTQCIVGFFFILSWFKIKVCSRAHTPLTSTLTVDKHCCIAITFQIAYNHGYDFLVDSETYYSLFVLISRQVGALSTYDYDYYYLPCDKEIWTLQFLLFEIY